MIRLLKFEGEKLIRNPVVFIGLILVLTANAVLFGQIFWGREGGAEEVERDRLASTAFAGRCFDEDMLAEIKAGIADGSLTGTSVERIYDNIFRSIEENRIRVESGQIGYDPVSGTVYGPSRSTYEELGLESVPYSWQTGWNMWIYLAENMMGFLLMYLIVTTAVIFSGEYTGGTAAVLLAAKYGKNRLIGAKILLGFVWNIGLTVLILGGSFLMVGLGYGFEGLDGNLRMLFMTNNNYAAMLRTVDCPLTTGEFIGVYWLFALSAALLSSALCLALSALIKNSAAAVISSLAVCYLFNFARIFLSEGKTLYKILSALPGRVALLYDSGMRYLNEPECLRFVAALSCLSTAALILPTILAARKFRAK